MDFSYVKVDGEALFTANIEIDLSQDLFDSIKKEEKTWKTELTSRIGKVINLTSYGRLYNALRNGQKQSIKIRQMQLFAKRIKRLEDGKRIKIEIPTDISKTDFLKDMKAEILETINFLNKIKNRIKGSDHRNSQLLTVLTSPIIPSGLLGLLLETSVNYAVMSLGKSDCETSIKELEELLKSPQFEEFIEFKESDTLKAISCSEISSSEDRVAMLDNDSGNVDGKIPDGILAVLLSQQEAGKENDFMNQESWLRSMKIYIKNNQSNDNKSSRIPVEVLKNLYNHSQDIEAYASFLSKELEKTLSSISLEDADNKDIQNFNKDTLMEIKPLVRELLSIFLIYFGESMEDSLSKITDKDIKDIGHYLISMGIIKTKRSKVLKKTWHVFQDLSDVFSRIFISKNLKPDSSSNFKIPNYNPKNKTLSYEAIKENIAKQLRDIKLKKVIHVAINVSGTVKGVVNRNTA